MKNRGEQAMFPRLAWEIYVYEGTCLWSGDSFSYGHSPLSILKSTGLNWPSMPYRAMLWPISAGTENNHTLRRLGCEALSRLANLFLFR